MKEISPRVWQLVWILIAIGCVAISCLARFESAQNWFRELASLIIGGVLVGRPGDTSQSVMLKLAASMRPPVLPESESAKE